MHTKGKWTTTTTRKTPNGLDELISVGDRPVAWAYKKEDALFIVSAPALLEALEKAREDINWMLNNRQFLNGHVFDYIDSAIASAKGE